MDYLNLNDIRNRAKVIFQNTQLSNKEFCESTDINPSTFSQIMTDKSPINIDTINKIVRIWGDEFSADWFVLGRGDMYIDPNQTPMIDIHSNKDDISSEKALNIIYEQQNEIKQLKAKLASLTAKEIESITVFYTDQSYTKFNP